MSEKYLIKMVDGGIKDIATDNWCEFSGCDTCGYGGWHIGSMTLRMKGFDLIVKTGTMYDFDIPTYEDMIHWFDNNMDKIKEMNQNQFIDFFKESNKFDCDEIEFFKQEKI